MAGQVPNPVREKRDLLQVLGDPSPTNLLVRNGLTGQVQVRASDPLGVEGDVVVSLQPSPGPGQRQYDLLGFADIEWWRRSSSLLQAVEQGWLFVDLTAAQANQQPVQVEPSPFDLFVSRPPNETIGDLLVWDGSSWARLPTGTAGQVLTADAPNVPVWSTPSTGMSSSVLTVSVTAGLSTANDVILADASSGSLTLTLPLAVGAAGHTFRIKKIDSTSNAVTVIRQGSNLIDGVTSISLGIQNESFDVISNGTNWYVL